MIDSPPMTIGLLYPGEMGAALAGILRSKHHRVITTISERSARTHELCQRAELETRETLWDVVAEADVLLSLVTPGSAEDVAAQVAQALDRLPRKDRIYIDANSISPLTMRTIAELFSESRVEVVDLTIHGLASRLLCQGTMFASGRRTDVVERLFGDAIKVKCLGAGCGKASMHKMLLGSMSKGMIALFLQTSLAALKSELLEEFLDDILFYYPDVLAFVERSLPTYPEHARRRSEEMSEWESTLAELDLRHGLASEVRRIFVELADSRLPSIVADQKEIPLAQLVKLIADQTSVLMEEPATPQLTTL